MEDLPLPSIFEQARKIHNAATESASDQVLFCTFVFFLIRIFFFFDDLWILKVFVSSFVLGNLGCCEERL